MDEFKLMADDTWDRLLILQSPTGSSSNPMPSVFRRKRSADRAHSRIPTPFSDTSTRECATATTTPRDAPLDLPDPPVPRENEETKVILERLESRVPAAFPCWPPSTIPAVASPALLARPAPRVLLGLKEKKDIPDLGARLDLPETMEMLALKAPLEIKDRREWPDSMAPTDPMECRALSPSLVPLDSLESPDGLGPSVFLESMEKMAKTAMQESKDLRDQLAILATTGILDFLDLLERSELTQKMEVTAHAPHGAKPLRDHLAILLVTRPVILLALLDVVARITLEILDRPASSRLLPLPKVTVRLAILLVDLPPDPALDTLLRLPAILAGAIPAIRHQADMEEDVEFVYIDSIKCIIAVCKQQTFYLHVCEQDALGRGG